MGPRDTLELPAKGLRFSAPFMGKKRRLGDTPNPGPPQADHSRGACPSGCGEREASTRGVAQSPFNPLSPPLSKGDSREFETEGTPSRGFAPPHTPVQLWLSLRGGKRRSNLGVA